jgi:hypothetical protein
MMIRNERSARVLHSTRGVNVMELDGSCFRYHGHIRFGRYVDVQCIHMRVKLSSAALILSPLILDFPSKVAALPYRNAPRPLSCAPHWSS